jgi:peptide deformylase
MSNLKGKIKAKKRKQEAVSKKNSIGLYRQRLLKSILKYDDPILEKKCEVVKDEDSVFETLKKMKKVLIATENGVGLSASQIGITDRIIAIRKDSSSSDILFMINPEIVKHSDEKKYGIEGCLSYPKTYAPIERYVSIEVKYLDKDRKEKTVSYKEGEIEGIIIQHEIDHLDGNCSLKDWWKNPEEKKKELEKKFEKKKEEESSYDIFESEEFKKEKELKNKEE